MFRFDSGCRKSAPVPVESENIGIRAPETSVWRGKPGKGEISRHCRDLRCAWRERSVVVVRDEGVEAGDRGGGGRRDDAGPGDRDDHVMIPFCLSVAGLV